MFIFIDFPCLQPLNFIYQNLFSSYHFIFTKCSTFLLSKSFWEDMYTYFVLLVVLSTSLSRSFISLGFIRLGNFLAKLNSQLYNLSSWLLCGISTSFWTAVPSMCGMWSSSFFGFLLEYILIFLYYEIWILRPCVLPHSLLA